MWVYFMKEKSEVFTHLQNFKAMVEKQTGLQVKCISSNGGGEQFSSEFSDYLGKDSPGSHSLDAKRSRLTA